MATASTQTIAQEIGLNEDVCRIFEQLRDIRVQQGESWRARAYDKVIPILRSYPKRIESGDEAKQIHGIGARMAARIDEILRTGTLAELGNIEMNEEDTQKEKVIQLFESIHRVGRKTAEKWYQKGYRSITDVPLEDCTSAQRLAIEFHSELGQRIPRDEIQECERILTEYLSPRNIQFQICGSYRRNKPDSGDIDILVIAQTLPDGQLRNVLAEILECPIFTHTLACGPKKFLGIGKIRDIHRRIDIEVVQSEEYPFAVVYFTGPGSFNIKMREYCAQHGLRLNEKSLIDMQGRSYPAKDEKHVFSMLGLQYLTPEERDKY